MELYNVLLFIFYINHGKHGPKCCCFSCTMRSSWEVGVPLALELQVRATSSVTHASWGGYAQHPGCTSSIGRRVVGQEALVNDKEKAKYGRADHQGCVLPSISSMLLECHGENRQWRFYYATKISLFCVCSKGIGQDLNIQVFHFANLLLLWHALYFSTRRACPRFPVCFVSCVCCPECSWAAIENCGHLNTAAGAWPASGVGHVRRMTVPDKAPHATFCWSCVCVLNVSL